jgi:large subunit ribosomal protein L3
MKIKTFFGYKEEQEQTFDEKGRRLVVTKIRALPLKVIRKKKEDKDGYNALQVEIKGKKMKKPVLKEIKANDVDDVKAGKKIKVEDVLKKDDLVKLSGVSKGKGFAGVMKRWNFKGGPRTHGQSDRQRAPGSIGQGTDPGRVRLGKKMPGRMGGKRATVINLKVFKVDEKKNELWIEGLVPGSRNALIEIIKLSN